MTTGCYFPRTPSGIGDIIGDVCDSVCFPL